MNYDETVMPAAYDAGRSYPPQTLDLWLTRIAEAAQSADVKDILDLGCGTGRYSNSLAALFQARVIAVDPSHKMLERAARKAGGGVDCLPGRGEAIPLPDCAVDLVFISMVLHHFSEPYAAVREIGRVLRSGGLVLLRAGTAEQIANYPYVPLFPSSSSILADALLPAAATKSMFTKGGFDCLRHEIVESPVADTWTDYLTKLECRADSILAQLPDEEFFAALDRAKRDSINSAAKGPVVEPVDFFVFRNLATS